MNSGHSGRNIDAPLIYFELVGPWSAAPGIVRVELETAIMRHLQGGPSIGISKEPVAHLRCNIPAARMLIHALSEAIQMAEKAAAPAATDMPN